MATNAGHGARTFRHLGRCVVRTTRAEPGLAIGLDFQHLQRTFFGLQNGQLRIHARRHVAVQAELAHALGNCLGDQGGRQVRVGT